MGRVTGHVYDNVMVVTEERPAVQAEIAPDSVMLNFAVDCRLSFRFVRDGQEAAESKDAFISHITEVFNEDTPLAERTVGGLDFDFRDGCAEVRYTFASQEKDKAIQTVKGESGDFLRSKKYYSALTVWIVGTEIERGLFSASRCAILEPIN